MRKLPVYLLLDVSGSMSGEPIEAVKNGVQMLHSALRRDPQALEMAYLSVITFCSEVNQIVPLTEVASFMPPNFVAGGGTCLDAALSMVVDCAQREVKKSTPEVKGDYKPLVFIMTDGIPTDVLSFGLDKFKKYHWGQVVACAAGDYADESVLRQISETVVKLATADQNSIAAFFKWVSASIQPSSRRVDAVGGDDELPPPPPEIVLIQ